MCDFNAGDVVRLLNTHNGGRLDTSTNPLRPGNVYMVRERSGLHIYADETGLIWTGRPSNTYFVLTKDLELVARG